MIAELLGTKIGQTQQFTEDGRRIPVTLIQAGPCWISRVVDAGTVKSYQLSFGVRKQISKALTGHLKKAGLEHKPRFLREVRVNELDEALKEGTEVKAADVFGIGDLVQVTGTSKGKGFAGGVKRHGFKGGPRTHGQADRERAPGSIGQTTTPGRVYKGKRMAGRMGNDRVTVKGLQIVSIDTEKHIVAVKGLVPGAKNGLVIIKKEV